MNEPTFPSITPEVPWPTSGNRETSPHQATVTTNESAPATGSPKMDRAVQAGHNTIDRVADASASTVRRLGERMHGAEDALHAKTAQLRVTRDEWVESMRGTVRSNPLASVAAGVALGMLIARVRR